MKIINVKCEYLNNPIGIDVTSPRINWSLEGVNKQTGFDILYQVNNSKEVLVHVYSSSMNYTFSESFNSRDIVSYKIRVYDELNNVSDYSDTYTFELGLLNKTDWISKWITAGLKVNKKHRYPVDIFKKVASLNNISKARLYISACGLYTAYINNSKVGHYVLTPGSTDYNKRIQYQTYDVTNMLKDGDNEFVVELADGWYRGSIGAKGFVNVFGTVTKFIYQLEVTCNDGLKTIISSDDSWSWCNDGLIRFSDLKDGEIIDNRMTPSFNEKCKVLNFTANLTASNNEGVIERCVSSPVKIFKSKSGKNIIEFKNNTAGYISFTVNASSGDFVHITMGEMLVDSEVSLKNIRLVQKGKISPLQEIKFTCKEGLNTYKSKYYYGGFKYLEVETNLDIALFDFKQVAISTDISLASSFSCSNEYLNRFYHNTVNSLYSNSVDIPTDCPTRERMGWTGDSQVFFESATFLTDYAAFTKKHIKDVFDRQDKNGRLPQIAPYSAEDWFMDVMNGSVGWADVGILTPYRFYKKFGDASLLKENFADIERYAKFMIKRCGSPKGLYSIYAKRLGLSKQNRKYQVNTGQSYGEWAEPSDVKSFHWTDFAMPHPEESMAYTAWMMDIMVEICTILNETKNIELYKEYRDGVTRAYQELRTKESHTLDTDRQAKLVRPLYLNLLTEEQTKFAEKRLLKALENYNYRVGTGFLSTPFILDVVSKIDVDTAYKVLLNEEKPGWIYMAKNDTGTIWEDWDGPFSQTKENAGIASLNHYSKGALVEWLFRGMCGINIISENKFCISPIIGKGIKHAECSYDSIYGNIKSSWKKEETLVKFRIVVPSNTTCDFNYQNHHVCLEPGIHEFSL